MPTKRKYLDLLISVIDQKKTEHPELTVHLLLSVARHGSVEYARENVEIAIEYFTRPEGSPVCGVELGGVATTGSFSDFEPLFREARAAGLPVALHCGENFEDHSEEAEMLDFGPDRLGHCVYDHPPAPQSSHLYRTLMFIYLTRADS